MHPPVPADGSISQNIRGVAVFKKFSVITVRNNTICYRYGFCYLLNYEMFQSLVLITASSESIFRTWLMKKHFNKKEKSCCQCYFRCSDQTVFPACSRLQHLDWDDLCWPLSQQSSHGVFLPAAGLQHAGQIILHIQQPTIWSVMHLYCFVWAWQFYLAHIYIFYQNILVSILCRFVSSLFIFLNFQFINFWHFF